MELVNKKGRMETRNRKSAKASEGSSVRCCKNISLKEKKSVKHHCIRTMTICVSLLLTGLILICMVWAKLTKGTFRKKEAYIDGTCE